MVFAHCIRSNVRAGSRMSGYNLRYPVYKPFASSVKVSPYRLVDLQIKKHNELLSNT
jgi:hypothetical protein